MKNPFLPFVQKALNRYLTLDPESIHRIHELRGKIVKIHLNMIPPLEFFLKFNPQTIDVLAEFSNQPDLIIKGTPLSLLNLSLTKDKRKHFFGDNVSIAGNLELGQQVTDLFDQLEIDWEEYISHWVGDISAHQIGRAAEKLKKFSSRFKKSMSQNVNEYIHEEINVFPPKEALQDFFSDIDVLRMDVDRIEARIKNLIRGVE